MLKILYAASNNKHAKIQLSRFCHAMEGKPYTLKIAAYKQSSPNINIDWSLDCLQNIFRPEHLTLDNDNFFTYYEQVKYYNPDLIISDLEYYTSYIANALDITLWQCSSSMINFALENSYKYNLGLFKKYAYLLNKSPINTQRIINIIDNSNCNFVYSHFVDTENPPEIKNNFEWIRPYYLLGKDYLPCQHNIVGGSLGTNKKIIDLLKHFPDSVYFSDFVDEDYHNPTLKNIMNQEEFSCNLKNSNIFVCEGQTSFLADAFYNCKYSGVLTNIQDTECLINSTISEKLGLSTSIYHGTDLSEQMMNKFVTPVINNKIKLLHEKVEEI